jgi:hypothetical protein
LQKEFSSLFDRLGITKSELERYQKTRQRLTHYGKSLDDVDEVVRILDNFKAYDNDPEEIVNDLSEAKNLKLTLASLRQDVSRTQNYLDRVHHERDIAEENLALYIQQLEVYNELENNGIFLSDLIFLKDKVFEIAKAFMKFRKDVETQYDSKLGFEKKVKEAEASLNRVHQDYDTLMPVYSKRRDVYDRVEELFELGRKPSDILVICGILRTSQGMELNRIEEDLKIYRSVQVAADALTVQIRKLAYECNMWQSRVDSLKSEEERICSKNKALLHQRDCIKRDFEGVMNKRLSEMRRAIQIEKIEHKRLEKERISNKMAMEAEERERINRFRKIDASLALSPLVEAARGIEVDGEAIRGAMVKAIKLMKSRLDPEYSMTTIRVLEQAIGNLESEFIVF